MTYKERDSKTYSINPDVDEFIDYSSSKVTIPIGYVKTKQPSKKNTEALFAKLKWTKTGP